MPKNQTFFNTTAEPAEVLRQFEQDASRQDKAVLTYFRLIADPSTPSQVHQWLIDSDSISSGVPLTSIRRSITTLTNRGLLEKTTMKGIGTYGRPESCWTLAAPLVIPNQLKLFGGR